MNIFTEVRAVLLADETVAGIVGSGTSAKIWNNWNRGDEVPCVVMESDSETENPDLGGTGSLVFGDITITCRDAESADSRTLRDAGKSALGGYSGTFDAILDDTVQSDTPRGDGSRAVWYDQVMSYTMQWSE